MKTKISILFLLSLLVLTSKSFAQEAVIELKSAILTTKIEVFGTKVVTKTYYDDYGKKQAAIATTTMGNVNQVTKGILNGKETISFDLNTKKGVKVPTPETINYINITDEIKEKYQLEEVGEEEYQDRKCKVYSCITEQNGQKVNAKVWIWKGLSLKSEINAGIVNIVTETTEIIENAEIPNGIFDIPEDIQF
ncbi:MAG: hypothetical protein MJ211_03060 [Bacteroidales bacterium]|nr:hypothetical protein [Bacteroidales bacterium]